MDRNSGGDYGQTGPEAAPHPRRAPRLVRETAIRPQPGPQETFHETSADIAVYGGSAGSGKTYALLLEPLRHRKVRGFGAVIFRRQATELTKEGGLWDESLGIYPTVGGRPRQAPHLGYSFPTGARITFGHLNTEAAKYDWHGSQIPLIEFDELTAFTRSQFFYMLSRNRSTCGVDPYIRATCNPDADSWVAEFIAWWIDQDTGYPIPERSGKLRYMVRRGDEVLWGDSPEECERLYGIPAYDPDTGTRNALSVTFIAAKITDNPALLRTNPRYLSNLKALATVERERLLYGNWKIRPAAGLYFRRDQVAILDRAPEDVARWVRSWDLAATEASEANPDPDYTVGVKMGRRPSGRIVIADVVRGRWSASVVREMVRATANVDGRGTSIRLQQDPGQAGKDQAQRLVAETLSGFAVAFRRVTGEKTTRAAPLAAQWQAGNVELVRGPWLDALLSEFEGFPEAGHDDIVDAAAEGHEALPLSGRPPDYSKGARPPRPEA